MNIISSMTIDGVAKVVCADLFKEDIDLFLSYNTHNRNLNSNRVDYLTRTIKSGEWQFNGDTIVFDADGVLRDGQTRLAAFKNAGYPKYRSLIVYLNKSSEDATLVQKTIDKVQPRHYHQQLMLDGVINAKCIAAIRRAVAAYSCGKSFNDKWTDSELDRYGKLYSDEISELCHLNCCKFQLRFPAVAIAVLCVIGKKFNRINDLKSWCMKVAMCDGISSGSTQYTLMRFLYSVQGHINGSTCAEIAKKVESIVMAHINGNECMTKAVGKRK